MKGLFSYSEQHTSTKTLGIVEEEKTIYPHNHLKQYSCNPHPGGRKTTYWNLIHSKTPESLIFRGTPRVAFFKTS
jgi:hypothetical protein